MPCSELSLLDALQRRMESVVLGLASGSYAQRVQVGQRARGVLSLGASRAGTAFVLSVPVVAGLGRGRGGERLWTAAWQPMVWGWPGYLPWVPHALPSALVCAAQRCVLCNVSPLLIRGGCVGLD